MSNNDDPIGPNVDNLERAFPMVDRKILEDIRGEAESLTFRSAADILAELESDGLVPSEDYHALADDATPEERSLDLGLNDPLDDPPDANPASPHNQERGRKAERHIRAANYSQKAQRAVNHGNIRDMVELLSTIDKWGNEALLAPNTDTLPDSITEPMQELASAMVLEIDDLAAEGDEAALKDIQGDFAALNSEGMRDQLQQKCNRRIEMLNNDGDDYAAVRDRIFNPDGDGHSPGEMRRLQDEAIRHKDITYEQAQELIKDVQAELERAGRQNGDS